jgi:hypothetical protein
VAEPPIDRKKYDYSRPSIPADVRRTVEVESGHACGIRRCGEHTYLELHHINGNREDNRVENLILLCDKHHKMAHAGIIDRKALLEYKKELKEAYRSELHVRIDQLEKMVQQMSRSDHEPVISLQSGDPDVAQKVVQSRSSVMAYTLEQLAIRHYEEDRGTFLDRSVTYSKEGARVQLDALGESASPDGDVVIEVRWIRKGYLDAPGHIAQLDAKVGVYELMTGRKARGVLIAVVPNESMKHANALPRLREAVELSDRKPEIIVYSYEDLSFTPGPLSAGLFTTGAAT